MDQKTKLYIGVGVGVLLLVLLVVVLVSYFGAATVAPGAAVATAATAAIAAATTRSAAKAKVEEAMAKSEAVTEALHDVEGAKVAMQKVAETVKSESHDQKAADGDKAFGG